MLPSYLQKIWRRPSLLVVIPAVVVLGAPTPPNIIFMLADDLGYNDVGIMQDESDTRFPIQTPHIDDLAANGVQVSLSSWHDDSHDS